MGLFINGIKIGRPYINGLQHNAYINGKKIWAEGQGPVPIDDGEFSFTVQDEGSFSIPVLGVSGGVSSYQSYNWSIDWRMELPKPHRELEALPQLFLIPIPIIN
jgi:hypothetical protein